MNTIHEPAENKEEVCEFCGGTGEVSVDETDSDGNIQRGVGTHKCICRVKHDDGDDYDNDR